MPLPPSENSWDFTPVFDLIQSLSKQDATTPQAASPQPLSRKESSEQLGVALGNLNRVWDYLGVQRDVPPPAVAPFERSTAGQATNLDAYASDGALYYPPSSKTVKWRDEEEGLNLTDVQDSPPSNDESHLTKNQRKKRNKKARKAAEQTGQLNKEYVDAVKDGKELADDHIDDKVVPLVRRTKSAIPGDASSFLKETNMVIGKKVESSKSVETQKPVELVKQPASVNQTMPQTAPKSAPINVSDAVKAVRDAMSRLPPMSQSPGTTPQKVHQLQRGPKAVPAPVANVAAKDFSKSPNKPDQTLHELTKPAVPPQPSTNYNTNQFLKQNIPSQPRNINNGTNNAPHTPVRPSVVATNMPKQWPTADPHAAHRQSLLTLGLNSDKPLQSQPVIHASAPHVAKIPPPVPQSSARSETSTRPKRNNEITPIAHQTSLDRNWSLLLKLMNNFHVDRKYLLSPPVSYTHLTLPTKRIV